MLIDVHMNVARRRAHETVPRLADPQFVAGDQQRIEVVLFSRDVFDGDQDVDDRFRRESRDGGRTDVVDADVGWRERSGSGAGGLGR